MTQAKQRLEPGSTARIYRDGGVLIGPNLLVPTKGRFEVRHLDPGHYVARDECGNEVAFEVSAREESTVVCGTGNPEGPTGAPGSGRVDAIETHDTGPQAIVNEFEPEHSPAARRRKLTVADAVGDEKRAPAAPGTSLVEEVPAESVQPADEAAWRAAAPQAESIDEARDAAAETDPPEVAPRDDSQDEPAPGTSSETPAQAVRRRTRKPTAKQARSAAARKGAATRRAQARNEETSSPAPGTTTPVETKPDVPVMGTTVTKPSGKTKRT